jgi:predicted nucleic acid-binding protein
MALKVVLDANVLYSARLRDLLMELAVAGIFDVVWTKRIEDEWVEAILRNRPNLRRQILRTASEMRRALPDARVDTDTVKAADISLPDADDAHVVAAALVSNATAIATFNVSDFPNGVLEPLGIDATSPDELLLSLAERDPEGVLAAVATVRARLRAPPVRALEYASGLKRAGCPRFAAWVASRAAFV